jgi:hypothetical protein
MRALAALLAAAVVIPAGASAAPPPTLGLIRGQSIVVTGTGFQSSERITVTLTSLGIHIRRTTASGGRFRIDFGSVPTARCAAMRVVAIGSRGSHAVLVLPRRICLQPAPPPTTPNPNA